MGDSPLPGGVGIQGSHPDAALSLLPPPSPEGGKCSTCSAITLASVSAAIGFLLGGGLVFVAMRMLATSGAPPAPLPTCKGACFDRLLDGTFAANVSTSKSVLGVEVWVKFSIFHTFHSENSTASVRLQPIESPFDTLKAFACADVPVTLDAACNLTVATNPCMAHAEAVNDIKALSYVWDAADQLIVSEVVQTPFFSSQYVWTERRVSGGRGELGEGVPEG